MNFIRIILFLLAFSSGATTHADPGHNHDEDKAASAATSQPRIETATETFELVGQLHGDQLALFLDRFETNEPVLDASVEVEAGGAKGQARFRADQGDYLVDDKALIAALAKPGKHALVFTITAGNDSDLLEGTMQVAADDHASPPSVASRFSPTTPMLLAALLAGALAVGAVVKIRRKNPTRNRP